MSYDRFKHETILMDAWGVVEDIQLISAALKDGTKKGDVVKMLDGTALMTAAKFDQLWSQFEESIPGPVESED